jgi:hypothetical protein
MKKVFSNTKNKLQELWNYVSELEGQIDRINTEISSLQNSTNGAWQELNKPKTVPPDAKFIDISKHYLVEFDDEGEVVLDANGQKKMSPLYNVDGTKTSVIWDETDLCFRFYAVYASGI